MNNFNQGFTPFRFARFRALLLYILAHWHSTLVTKRLLISIINYNCCTCTLIISLSNHQQTSPANSPAPIAAVFICLGRFLFLNIVSPAVFIWKKIECVPWLQPMQKPPPSANGCFAKVWISTLEFLRLFIKRDVLPNRAPGWQSLSRFTCQQRGCGKIVMWIKAETCPDCEKKRKKKGLAVLLFGVRLCSRLVFDQWELLLTWMPGYF